MPPPRSLRQLRGLQGQLAFIRRFISNLSGRCQPFAKLMKKDVRFVWDNECQEAFDKIKEYLLSAPILAAPIPGKPLILYTAALEESLGALLAQQNEEGKENALYYISRRLIEAEIRYSPIEKHCLALIFTVQKLRHYLLSHKVTLISRIDPLKFLMTRPTLTGRLARWAVLLLQFDITYVPQKAVKGQILADFLAAHPIPASSPLNDDLPDEQVMLILEKEKLQVWELYFDGASSIKTARSSHLPKARAGVGLVFITPEGGIIRRSYGLTEPCTNNEAEYEALIAGLEEASHMGVQNLKIYGDSLLVINQVKGIYKISKFELAHYHKRVLELMELIPNVTLTQVPRGENNKADCLAKLAKEMASMDDEYVTIEVFTRRVLEPLKPKPPLEKKSAAMRKGSMTSIIPHIREREQSSEKALDELCEICVANDQKDWRQLFIDYFREGKLPEDKSLAAQISKRILRYAYVGNTLYRRSFEQMWLRCLGTEEANKVLFEIHRGLCGAHQSGPKMAYKIKRMGYYWPTIINDCIAYAKRCHECQVHGDLIHQSPSPLHPTIVSWPFECWGTDIIGPIDPPSSAGHRFILAVTDYFSKWAEAAPFKEITAEHVLQFFTNNIVYRFGVPRRIISDNGSAFKSIKIYRFVERHKIDWRYSSIYNPRANGLAEAFNKTLIKLLKKILTKNKREWHTKMVEALWAYRTTYKTPTKATPYSLVFGAEAILPLEVELPSLRVAARYNLTQEESARLRLEELDALDEIRLQAQQNLEVYRAKMSRAFDCMIRPRTFQEGELVLVRRRPILPHRKIGGKFEPNWEGPYVIEKVYQGGAYQLIDLNGIRPIPPINGRYLKKYYV